MAQGFTSAPRRSNAYNIFILFLTIFSLVIMVAMFLPLNAATIGLLRSYDVLICFFFLIDFIVTFRAAYNKKTYFIKERGWLDLVGSIPTVGIYFKYGSLLRLARLSRASRIARNLGRKSRGDLIRDVLQNRSQYAGFVIILLAIIILAFASILVLQFESASPDANITTGWDAFWYSIVTITTVGYGDYYPVTFWGRVTAIFIMVAGVGIIGALASLMASLLIGESHATSEDNTVDQGQQTKVEKELAAIREELAALRQLMERDTVAETQKELLEKTGKK
jgi:voltage-gated potassium channel